MNNMEEHERKKKSQNYPDALYGWPESWDCFSPEQRRLINDWYIQKRTEIEKEHEKERKKKDILNSEALLFSVSPFVFCYAFLNAKGSIIGFILQFLSAYIIYGLIVILFFDGYLYYGKKKIDSGKIERIFFRLCALAISCFATYIVLSQTGIIA